MHSLCLTTALSIHSCCTDGAPSCVHHFALAHIRLSRAPSQLPQPHECLRILVALVGDGDACPCCPDSAQRQPTIHTGHGRMLARGIGARAQPRGLGRGGWMLGVGARGGGEGSRPGRAMKSTWVRPVMLLLV